MEMSLLPFNYIGQSYKEDKYPLSFKLLESYGHSEKKACWDDPSSWQFYLLSADNASEHHRESCLDIIHTLFLSLRKCQPI